MKRVGLMLYLIGLVPGVMFANESINNQTLSHQEPVKVTIYSLFIKNPSYQKLQNNISKIEKEVKNIDFSKAILAFKNEEIKIEENIDKSINSNYKEFVKSSLYPKTFAIYKDEKLLQLSKKYDLKILVDRKIQRIKLLINGKVAIDSPCTTGSAKKIEPHTKIVYNKVTPKGIFEIKEKIENKRSNIFGKLYRYGKVVFRGDRRKYKGPSAKYEGALLKNWMRLTSSGIGIHGSSHIKRYPASNGCIRVPYSVVGKIFSLVKEGTKVIIR